MAICGVCGGEGSIYVSGSGPVPCNCNNGHVPDPVSPPDRHDEIVDLLNEIKEGIPGLTRKRGKPPVWLFRHDRRIGSTAISNCVLAEEPAMVANVVFKDCVVLHVYSCEYSDTTNYIFYSPDLELIEECVAVPDYHCDMSNEYDDDGKVIKVNRTWRKSQ